MIDVHWDLETYSEAPIKKVGAWRYAADPSTEVLCCAYKIGSEDVALWLPGDPPPPFAQEPAKYMNHIWNVGFEYAIWHHLLREQWGAPPDIAHWSDTAALAAAMALPRSLGECGAALGMPADKQKDKRGAYLIRRLCQPYRGKRVHDEALLQELYEYCRQDVIAEYEIGKRLRPLSPLERQVWECDRRINIRGVHIDRARVEDAIAIYDDHRETLMQELQALTGLDNPNSRDQFLRWLHEQGIDAPDLNQSTLRELLEAL